MAIPNPIVTVQGNMVFVEYQVWDNRQSPRQPYDPDESVKIDLYDPDQSKVIDQADMTKVATGRYRYEYQLATDAMLGTWAAQVWARHAGKQNVSRRQTFLSVE